MSDDVNARIEELLLSSYPCATVCRDCGDGCAREGRQPDARDLAARLRDAEAENARLQTIAHRLAQCWMYGDWKAQTKNEQDIEDAMREIGWWPIPGETLIEREDWVAARASEARDA